MWEDVPWEEGGHETRDGYSLFGRFMQRWCEGCFIRGMYGTQNDRENGRQLEGLASPSSRSCPKYCWDFEARSVMTAEKWRALL